MLRRRGLLGLFAAAPVIIAADRLMPVRTPWVMRPFTMADLKFVEQEDVYSFHRGFAAQFMLNGTMRRHAVWMSDWTLVDQQHSREIAKQHLLQWANDVRLSA